jgi:HD-GYP domain-containing protein (c-di-GMP phosphodiesterase class II)
LVAATFLAAVFLFPRIADTEVARHGWQHFMLELGAAFLAAACGTFAALSRFNRDHRQFVETMAQALDARDPYTAGHSTRVAEYSRVIARSMGLSRRATRAIGEAAELHDIGKIGLPDAVLQKTGPLTAGEMGLIRLHPQIGCKILEKTGQFQRLLPVVELHHENWDGTGYPYGFRGENVPIDARIVHVADAFDAMTSARCYRAAPTRAWALAELRRCAGTQFDPRVTVAFLALLDRGVFETTLRSAAAGPSYLGTPARGLGQQRHPMSNRTM